MKEDLDKFIEKAVAEQSKQSWLYDNEHIDILESDEIRMLERILTSKVVPLRKRKQDKITRSVKAYKKNGNRNPTKVDKRLFWNGKNEFDVARAEIGFKPIKITTKVCLSCQAQFESEGSHNRMCINCRKSNGYQE